LDFTILRVAKLIYVFNKKSDCPLGYVAAAVCDVLSATTILSYVHVKGTYLVRYGNLCFEKEDWQNRLLWKLTTGKHIKGQRRRTNSDNNNTL
jgi:hypothetical protein